MSRVTALDISPTESSAVIGALAGYSVFYHALAASEPRASLVAEHRASAFAGDAIAGIISGAGGRVGLTIGQAAIFDRGLRMGMAYLQRTIGNRALSPAIREAARDQQYRLGGVFERLRPDLQHAPRTS